MSKGVAEGQEEYLPRPGRLKTSFSLKTAYFLLKTMARVTNRKGSRLADSHDDDEESFSMSWLSFCLHRVGACSSP